MSHVKVNDLETDQLYADDNGRFFRIYQVEEAPNPREDEDNVATLFTWEEDFFSIDKREISLKKFAKKQGVDVSKPIRLILSRRRPLGQKTHLAAISMISISK